MTVRGRWRGSGLLLGLLLGVTGCGDANTAPVPAGPDDIPATASDIVVTVAAGTVVNPDAPRLLGISYDGRSSLVLANGTPVGYHDPATGLPYAGVAPLWDDFPITTVRYPGNAVNQGMNWKQTIGPAASRPIQTLVGAQPQRVRFGFDEFMAMVAARGVSGEQVQIMVNIYPTATEADPAQSAADLVEYANAPNDGSNPGGGTDWAAVRAANGHAAPYAIRTWNIGNEPWSPSEFNFVPAGYLAIAVPIIDAMRAIDPTIHITLPASGAATSAWNAAMLNAPALAGKVHGLSPHAFYHDVSTTPSPALLESTLRGVAVAAQARGLRIILGDHAQDVIAAGAPTQAEKDRPMQWEGVVTTAHFLAMLSQLPNVERANFWIFGAPAATWAPIRRNADGSYTALPLARFYRTLRPLTLDRVLGTTTTAAFGAPSAHATTFGAVGGGAAHVMVVNWHRTATYAMLPPTIAGMQLTGVDRLLATALDAETYTTAPALPKDGGRYAVPPMSILLLHFAAP